MRANLEELGEIVLVVHKEWIRRLSTTQDLQWLCDQVCARTLFEKGIAFLSGYFHGSFAPTFEDIFALMHVAFALAYMMHRDDETYDWHGFIEHVLQWRCVLLEANEVFLFTNVIASLAGVQTTSTITPSESSEHHDVFFSKLRDGPIMRNYLMFLDGKFIACMYRKRVG